MEKQKSISQDEEKVAQDNVQQATDEHIKLIEDLIEVKEKVLMSL